MAKNKKTNNKELNEAQRFQSVQKRKKAESTATLGMVILAVSLLITLFNPFDEELKSTMRWAFATGAVTFLIARVVNLTIPGDSSNVKRLRRMEFWAGISFATATFFWFYHTGRSDLQIPGAVEITSLRDTIVFTLAGAVIQIIATWLIYFREKKENKVKESQK